MKNLSKESALLRAKTRVQKLKGFYYHLGIYLSVNTIIVVFKIIRKSGQFESLFNLNYSGMWLFWGVGLSIHAFSVFLLPLIIGHDWEERKIKQFINEEQSND